MNLRLVVGMAGMALSVGLLAGCSDGRVKMDVASTDGRVVCEGKPVPFVAIYFEPLKAGDSAIVGKQGIGMADEKGNFTISTYGQNDSAVIGKHRVRVGRPLGEGHKDFKCDCVLNEEIDVTQVDVAAGKNNFEVVLKPKKEATPKEKALDQKAAAAAAKEEE